MAIKHTYMMKDGLTTKDLTPIRAIRAKCLECSNFSNNEVKLCQIKDCALYPFRFGKNPNHALSGKKLTEEQKERLFEQLRKNKL